MMIDILAYAGDILASGSDDDGFPIGVLLLLAGPLFYAYVFMRYRNADKRHMHESETKSTMLDVQVADQVAGSVKGVRNSRMQGANNRSVKGNQQAGAGGVINQKLIADAAGSLFGKK